MHCLALISLYVQCSLQPFCSIHCISLIAHLISCFLCCIHSTHISSHCISFDCFALDYIATHIWLNFVQLFCNALHSFGCTFDQLLPLLHSFSLLAKILLHFVKFVFILTNLNNPVGPLEVVKTLEPRVDLLNLNIIYLVILTIFILILIITIIAIIVIIIFIMITCIWTMSQKPAKSMLVGTNGSSSLVTC